MLRGSSVPGVVDRTAISRIYLAGGTGRTNRRRSLLHWSSRLDFKELGATHTPSSRVFIIFAFIQKTINPSHGTVIFTRPSFPTSLPGFHYITRVASAHIFSCASYPAQNLRLQRVFASSVSLTWAVVEGRSLRRLLGVGRDFGRWARPQVREMSGFASGVAVFSDGATIDAVSPAVSVEKKGSGALVALVVEEKDPPRRKSGIQDLASECVVNILEFLRAVDLCSVSEVDRTVFSAGRLRLGISFQLNHVSQLCPTALPRPLLFFLTPQRPPIPHQLNSSSTLWRKSRAVRSSNNTRRPKVDPRSRRLQPMEVICTPTT